MLSLFAVIISIALLDSLNPVTIAVHIYLLGTPQPRIRTLTFIAGIFLAYFSGGLILLLGLNSILMYLANLPDQIWYSAQAVVALALIGFAVYLWRGTSDGSEPVQPASLHPINTFWLGFAATLSDLPTAIPYIAALERMLQAKLSVWWLLGATAFYNLIYILPLLILLGLYFVLGTRGVATLQSINRFISKWSPPVLAILCALTGLVLLADCTAFVFGRTLL